MILRLFNVCGLIFQYSYEIAQERVRRLSHKCFLATVQSRTLLKKVCEQKARGKYIAGFLHNIADQSRAS